MKEMVSDAGHRENEQEQRMHCLEEVLYKIVFLTAFANRI